VSPLRLTEPPRPRSCQPRRRDDDDRALAVEHGELSPIGDACLVNVTGEDDLGAGGCEALQDQAPARKRSLPRPPRGVAELMVKAHRPQGARRRRRELALGGRDGLAPEPSRLVSPRPHGVQADHEQLIGPVHGRRRLPLFLECGPRAREARGRQQGDVVVPRHDEQRRSEASEELGGLRVLLTPAAVRDVPCRDDEIGADPLDEREQRAAHVRAIVRPEMEVGDVDQAGWHSRGRLYTDFVADEPTELFDDLYLGLRAGGAMRKQRRGEPLTMEEEAALNRWGRLSSWRKAIAVGAFALGTFGLGFTLGGLVFGRSKKAKA
jgi:hypothetical protein